MYKFQFYVGTTTQQRDDISSEQITQKLHNFIASAYPNGHTFTNVIGGWINDKGHYIKEQSIIVTVICSNIDKAKTVKAAIMSICFQDSVLLTAEKLEVVEF